MIDRARSLVASILCLALILLSPGLEAPRLFAAALESAPVAETAVLSVPRTVPSGLALSPSALGPVAAPLAAPSLSVSAAAAPSVSAAVAFPAPALPAAAAPAESGHDARPSAAAAPAAAPAAPSVDAAAPIQSLAAYKAHALLLKVAAVLTGTVFSLRPAGPALSDRLIAAAADRRAVLSDFDETLAQSNAAFDHRLPPDMVEAVEAVRAAGKTVDVISDRPESVLDALSTLPPAARAGMYVAVDAGGRVYRYDDAGQAAALVHQEPPMSDAVKAVVGAAADAARARFPEVGARAFSSLAGDVGADAWGPYTYTLRLQVGSTPDQLRGAASLLQVELDRRGAGLTVKARFAKDPANPPYVTLTVNTKASAARFIAQERGLTARDVVTLGDGMYAPREGARFGGLARLARNVSGRTLPAFGNASDAEMQKALPGALTLSVGGTGDARRANLFVLGESGPAASRRVLLSVASRMAGEASGFWRGVREFLGWATLWVKSCRHYFFDVNVENWREYRAARAAARAQRPELLVKDERGFFVDTRLMGMIGGTKTVGSRSGSDAYVTREALRLYDLYFSGTGDAARAAFAEFLERAKLYNPKRSHSNLRKHIRKALHAASLMPAEALAGYFAGLMLPVVNDSAETYQHEEQAASIAAFRAAVRDALRGEDAAAPDRVVGVVVLGSFAIGAATAKSDFDLHVLTADGRSRRVPAFLARLEKSWSADPQSRAHPLNAAEFAFYPSASFLLKIHHDPFLVLAGEDRLERALSPPPDRYADRSRPDAPTRGERAQWSLFRALLKGATRLSDLNAAAAGPEVAGLDAAARRRATIGWLAGRTLYLAGYVLAGTIAYPIFAQALVGHQGYADLMSLGALAGILLSSVSGVIAQRFSQRNSFAINNVVRLITALALPALVATGTAGFWPLLAVALVTSWNVSSSLIAEDKILPALAGGDAKRLSALNAAANLNFIGLNVALGLFLSAGSWIDGLTAHLGLLPGLSAVFAVNAALAAAGLAVQWFTLPNVRVAGPAVAAPSAEAAPQASGRGRDALIWGGLLGAGAALYAVLHSVAPQFATLPLVGASLLGLAATSEGLKRIWKSSVLRSGAVLGSLYALVVFPVQSILVPFASRDLNGGGLLQGRLQGALFFGQMLATSSLLRLPGRWNTAVRAGTLGTLGAWLAFSLFPHNLIAAAAGTAVALAFDAAARKLTDRGWMRFAFVGLAALGLPLAFWGSVPAFLLSLALVGLVSVPNKIAIDTIMQGEARADAAHTGKILGARSALSSIAAAFGYAAFGALAGAFHPAFPTALWPMVGMFLVVGALLWAAPRKLGARLAPTLFKTDASAAPATQPETLDQISARIAARVAAKGVKVVITDYDGTLMNKNADDKAVVASERLAALIQALHDAGVRVVISTNHFFTGDHNGMTNLLGDRLTPRTRADMMYVVQSGARIYEYDGAGVSPTRESPTWKEVGFTEAENEKIVPAFEEAARSIGLAPGDYKIYQEDSRSLIELRNHIEREKELYDAVAQINARDGFGYLVQLKPYPTMRENKVPYVQYFKANKGTGAKKAFEILKARGVVQDESQVLIFGDDFKPEGNDLFMAQALPGALAVSVGKSWDKTQPNVVQSSVRNQDATQELFARLAAAIQASGR
ncbi:MAG: hypothetical protein HKL90_00150 [Elusimicrobia bacterium]|nr:hypothetical protein [Elusimicrobiota bacterium]